MADEPLEYGRKGSSPYYPPHVPHATATLGMWLFLAALFMLFAGVMVAYLAIRLGSERSPPLHEIHFPKLLWLSTALVISVSVALARSLHFVRLEKQTQFRLWLNRALWLAVGFIIVQTPAMIELLRSHKRLEQRGVYLYGFVFFLILVHAAHVVGGIVALIRVAYLARRDVFDHENYQPVRHTAMYWHFLDAVWLTMFVMFLAIG